jgi:hypothetical protein
MPAQWFEDMTDERETACACQMLCYSSGCCGGVGAYVAWFGVLLVVSVLQMPVTMQQLSQQPGCVAVPALLT